MSKEAPTDALRLVPIDMQIESILHDLVEEVSAAQRGSRVKARARQCCARGAAKNALLNLLAAAPASPLPGGGWLGAEHLSEAITRLTKITAGDEIEVAYADFTFPGHTFRADIRALLSALPAAPTGEPK